jgi:exopolysaccharide biosynthesis polyprenyl glycosylphosphotransferase
MSSTPRKNILLPVLTVLVDCTAIEVAFLAAYWLRFDSPLTSVVPVTLGYPQLEAYILGSFFVIPIWVWLLMRRGMYATRRVQYFSDEFFALIRVITLGMLVVMAAAFFYRAFSFSRLVFALLFGSSIFFLSAGRWIMLRFEQAWYASGRDLLNVLFVGRGSSAATIAASFKRRRDLGYNIIGLCTVSDAGDPPEGVRVLGSIQDLQSIIREHKIDLVLLTLDNAEHQLTERLVRDCDGLDVELMIVPDLVELLTSQVRIKNIDGIPFLRIKGVALGPWNAISKRAFDIIFALVVLIAISPIFLLLAFVVTMTSKGPVFFSQERVGLDGRTFNVLKFRSMRLDAETATGPVWASKDDPRTTGVGKFLRRFSLDELPQLLNVLKGDMSLVGPRPERPHFVEQFSKDIPKYLERHRVKTGMTGWAQVNGLRGNAPIEERTKYDIYYVENWSLVFDLKIILKTVRAVIFGEDAY